MKILHKGHQNKHKLDRGLKVHLVFPLPSFSLLQGFYNLPRLNDLPVRCFDFMCFLDAVLMWFIKLKLPSVLDARKVAQISTSCEISFSSSHRSAAATIFENVLIDPCFCFPMYLNSAYSMLMASIEWGWWRIASYFFDIWALSSNISFGCGSTHIATLANADDSFKSSSGKWNPSDHRANEKKE